MLEILGKTNIDFMGKRKWAFIFSGIMVVLGIVALVQIARGAANLGIDFCGWNRGAVEVRPSRFGSTKREKPWRRTAWKIPSCKSSVRRTNSWSA